MNLLGRECSDASGSSKLDIVLAPDAFSCVALLLDFRMVGSLARLECCAGTGALSRLRCGQAAKPVGCRKPLNLFKTHRRYGQPKFSHLPLRLGIAR
jgi:hypothetical protein